MAPVKSSSSVGTAGAYITEFCVYQIYSVSEGTVKTISFQPPATKGNIWYHIWRFWWGQVPDPELSLHSADLTAQDGARWTCSFSPLYCWDLRHIWVQSWQSLQATELLHGIKSEKTDLIFWKVTVHSSRLEIYHNKKKSEGFPSFLYVWKLELSCRTCLHPCVISTLYECSPSTNSRWWAFISTSHHLQTSTSRLQVCSMGVIGQRIKYHGGVEKKTNLITF